MLRKYLPNDLNRKMNSAFVLSINRGRRQARQLNRKCPYCRELGVGKIRPIENTEILNAELPIAALRDSPHRIVGRPRSFPSPPTEIGPEILCGIRRSLQRIEAEPQRGHFSLNCSETALREVSGIAFLHVTGWVRRLNRMWGLGFASAPASIAPRVVYTSS
jgi:hypothetical protein